MYLWYMQNYQEKVPPPNHPCQLSLNSQCFVQSATANFPVMSPWLFSVWNFNLVSSYSSFCLFLPPSLFLSSGWWMCQISTSLFVISSLIYILLVAVSALGTVDDCIWCRDGSTVCLPAAKIPLSWATWCFGCVRWCRAGSSCNMDCRGACYWRLVRAQNENCWPISVSCGAPRSHSGLAVWIRPQQPETTPFSLPLSRPRFESISTVVPRYCWPGAQWNFCWRLSTVRIVPPPLSGTVQLVQVHALRHMWPEQEFPNVLSAGWWTAFNKWNVARGQVLRRSWWSWEETWLYCLKSVSFAVGKRHAYPQHMLHEVGGGKEDGVGKEWVKGMFRRVKGAFWMLKIKEFIWDLVFWAWFGRGVPLRVVAHVPRLRKLMECFWGRIRGAKGVQGVRGSAGYGNLDTFPPVWTASGDFHLSFVMFSGRLFSPVFSWDIFWTFWYFWTSFLPKRRWNEVGSTSENVFQW